MKGPTEGFHYGCEKVKKVSWFCDLKDSAFKDDVTRDDSQRQFLAQHSVATLLQCCFE